MTSPSAATASVTDAPDPAPAWQDAWLHVVTGKGGTGKTTVAAVLATALAQTGRRVLLAEVEQRGGIAPVLGCDPLDATERLVGTEPSGGELHAVSLDARAALMEYLTVHARLGAAGMVLDQVGAVELATSIAPGLADVLVVGKLYEAARRTDAHQRRRGAPASYDAVVVDAPPTGRVVRFLDAGAQVGDLARVGPIHRQARSVSGLVRSPRTAVHLVTLLEDMPVTETLDAAAELLEHGMHPGLLVVDQVHDDGLDEDDLAAFDAAVDGSVTLGQVAAALRDAGAEDADALAARLVGHAREHATRLDLEGERQAQLDGLGLPTVLLPRLVEGVTPSSLPRLARLLAEQGGLS